MLITTVHILQQVLKLLANAGQQNDLLEFFIVCVNRLLVSRSQTVLMERATIRRHTSDTQLLSEQFYSYR
jgi:hypothetical protein